MLEMFSVSTWAIEKECCIFLGFLPQNEWNSLSLSGLYITTSVTLRTWSQSIYFFHHSGLSRSTFNPPHENCPRLFLLCTGQLCCDRHTDDQCIISTSTTLVQMSPTSVSLTCLTAGWAQRPCNLLPTSTPVSVGRCLFSYLGNSPSSSTVIAIIGCVRFISGF